MSSSSTQVSPRQQRSNSHGRRSYQARASGAGDHTPCFTEGLFDDAFARRLRTEYGSASPFKHAIVPHMIECDLIESVKDECLNELSFVQKDTDTCKVFRTGKFDTMSGLTETTVSRLQHLRTLRDALYSRKFRSWIMQVTGCISLSGIKIDMSVTAYKKGCYELNHDDITSSNISMAWSPLTVPQIALEPETRVVSYTLSLPITDLQDWQTEWGGALEFYPAKPNAQGIKEPEPIPSKSITPCWNQFVFYEVRPGEMYHAIEEVVVGGGEDQRQCLLISGWFHAAQPEELTASAWNDTLLYSSTAIG